MSPEIAVLEDGQRNESELVPLMQEHDACKTPVYPIIHMIHQDMLHFIDTPLTYEALTAPDLTYTLVKPLEDKYAAIQRKGNHSVVFCFLLNKVNFRRDQNIVTSSVSRTRAALCEIMATRLLRHYGDNILDSAFVITTSWSVYFGADEQVLKRALDNLDVDDVEERVGNAIEMAIIGGAKRFIASPACQKIIDGIWSGKVVYQAQSSHSILSDTYKQTQIHLYDPHNAPVLDHYRLKVPAIRSVLEYLTFLGLFFLFVLTLEMNEINRLNWAEIAFMIYAFGFALEKVAAMQEHGLRVYFTGTWNGFDLALITIFIGYASLRLYGFRYDNLWAKENGITFLALAACLIFPRLAFVTFKNSLMVLGLRAMILQFFFLMLIAMICFAGFLYALWTLARNDAKYSAGEIFWWMADLWFGLDATGFVLASSFNPYLGPILMVSYTCLSNTLLLTVLVSILSYTFSSISEDAAAEAMFRRAALTIEGVKADYLFSYQPPINVFALMIMLPARFILSPRWFHKVNVFMIRLTSFPLLLAIAYYERQMKRTETQTFGELVSALMERAIDKLPRPIKRMALFEGLFSGKGADIDIIFEIEEEIMNNKDEHALDVSNTGVESRAKSESLQGHPSQTSSSREAIQATDRTAELPVSSSFQSRSIETSEGVPQQQSTGIRLKQLGEQPTFLSPLAQIYQPLVVDDDILESEAPVPSPVAQTFLGLGPRRRVSSMHRFPPRRSLSGFGRQFASNGSDTADVSAAMLEDIGSISSDEQRKDNVIVSEPESISYPMSKKKVPEKIMDRLAIIEERQIRIEELILQLSQSMRSAKGQ